MSIALKWINDLGELLSEERAEFKELLSLWIKARKEEKWAKADRLRAKVYLWNTTYGELWHPVMEHSLNRQRRAFKRMNKYGVSVYPWEDSRNI